MQISGDLLDKFGQRFGAGDVIFKENDPATHMYIILKGQVEIFKRVKQAHRLLSTLGDGDIFGEMAMIDSKPRSAMARAKTDVLVCAIDNALMERMIHENMPFAHKLIRVLTVRLREADHLITELLGKDRTNIVVQALAAFAKKQGQKSYKGSSIPEKEFLAWMAAHVGLEKHEVTGIIIRLIDEEMVQRSSVEPGTLILTERLARRALPRSVSVGT